MALHLRTGEQALALDRADGAPTVDDAPLDARVSAFYSQRPALDDLLGDVGAVAGARFAPSADGYRVRAASPPPPQLRSPALADSDRTRSTAP